MKRLIFIPTILSALLLPAMALGERRTSEKGSPAIEFAQTSHDFGTVKAADGFLTHEFLFKNAGTAPLTIITVSAPCGCTQPDFDPKPLAPGDSSEITLRFDPSNFSGEFTKTALVRTNVKGRAGRVTLTITGVVIPQK
ncbi:MAG: DUF1573 domain-containing protein [Muribaculaceae bacterium]|nr:DUF1573 domain-containing protein [Muribaculaceae bacterium]